MTADRRVSMLSADELREQARRHELAGRFDRALQCYRSALARERETAHPGPDPALFLSMADLHYRTGDAGSSLENYRLAAARYLEMGLTENAESVHLLSSRLLPDRVEPYLARAALLIGDGREEAAAGVLDGLADRLADDGMDVAPERAHAIVSETGADARARLEEALRRRGLEELVP